MGRMGDGGGGVSDVASCPDCITLMHQALNLTMRGRKLDMVQNRAAMLDASSDGDEWLASGGFDAFVERHNMHCNPGREIEARSLTPQLWAEDAFAHDLAEWETRARKHMIQAHP